MKLLPQECRGPLHNPLHFGNDPDYDPNPGSGLRSGCEAEVCSLVSEMIVIKVYPPQKQ